MKPPPVRIQTAINTVWGVGGATISSWPGYCQLFCSWIWFWVVVSFQRGLSIQNTKFPPARILATIRILTVWHELPTIQAWTFSLLLLLNSGSKTSRTAIKNRQWGGAGPDITQGEAAALGQHCLLYCCHAPCCIRHRWKSATVIGTCIGQDCVHLGWEITQNQCNLAWNQCRWWCHFFTHVWWWQSRWWQLLQCSTSHFTSGSKVEHTAPGCCS